MYHYGNDDRVFRILSGSPEECSTGASTFDPRARPWYVAASSGPKDIIIILDTSGSMSNYGRLGVMNEVAKRVISTLVSVFFQSLNSTALQKMFVNHHLEIILVLCREPMMQIKATSSDKLMVW